MCDKATAVASVPETELPEYYEVVYGRVVEIAPKTAFASEVANRLHDHMTVYARRTNSGRARSVMIFRIPHAEDENRCRLPAIAFITFDRWPNDRPMPYHGDVNDVMPNLVVEVTSPNIKADAPLDKAHEYLRGWAELVWIVYPRARQLYAYTALDAAPRLYTVADTLDGGTVLPGFSMPMAGLFPPLIAKPESPDEE